MDPVSVPAAIVGLLGAAAKVSEICYDFMRNMKDAPRLAQHVVSEVNDLKICLQRLQDLIVPEDSLQRSRRAMITLDKLCVVLTHCVMTFSELEDTLESLKPQNSMQFSNRLKWMVKEPTISKLLERLQSSKRSLILVLTTLTCASLEDAERSIRSLTSIVNEVLARNKEICRNLETYSIANGMINHQSNSQAGKSTVLKQLELAQGIKPTALEVEEARLAIRTAMIKTFRRAASEDLSLQEKYGVGPLQSPTLGYDGNEMDEVDSPLSHLKWLFIVFGGGQDSDTLSTGNLGCEGQITSHSQAMIENLHDILWGAPARSHIACLYAYIQTLGIYKSRVVISPFDFKIWDVSGTPNVRRKWRHCLSDKPDYIIYVVDLNEYCQFCEDDKTVSLMQDSLKLFDKTVNWDLVRDIPVFLLLNKADIFQRAVERRPLSGYFEDYKKDSGYIEACNYIASCFSALDHRPPGKLHCHVINSLDTVEFQKVWQQIRSKMVDGLLSNSTHNAGGLAD
ncbi:MAG: hypothetical protein Q9219_005895 [cf. Caloplaca sp. 3 TL-2023]